MLNNKDWITRIISKEKSIMIGLIVSETETVSEDYDYNTLWLLFIRAIGNGNCISRMWFSEEKLRTEVNTEISNDQ